MQPNPRPGFRPNLWVILGCAGVLALVLIECAFDPISWVANVYTVRGLPAKLAPALELWKSKTVASYDLDAGIFTPPSCLTKVTLHVRQNTLADVTPIDAPWRAACQSIFKNLTITEMFRVYQDQLKTLDASKTSLKVEFDPDYGFITRYVSNCGYRIGFLNPNGSSCVVGYEFTNFHPLP
jgi:Family of unknown function (DUF6174)